MVWVYSGFDLYSDIVDVGDVEILGMLDVGGGSSASRLKGQVTMTGKRTHILISGFTLILTSIINVLPAFIRGI